MIKCFLFYALLVSTANATNIVKSESNILEIKLKKNDIEILLPPVALQVLEKWNPDFKAFNQDQYSPAVLALFKELGDDQVPIAFIDDFDGNDKKDIVILGSDSKNQYAIAILQLHKKWTLIKIAQWSIDNFEKTAVPSEKISSGTTQTVEVGIPLYVLKAIGKHGEILKKKNKAGIQIESYMGPGDVYEIINNKAVKLILPSL